MSDDVQEIKKHIKTYMLIFGALLVLTVLTVAVSKVHFGAADSNVANITIGMIIATVKASLVALFFMHLLHERMEVYRILLLAGVMAVVLFVLTWLHYVDPITNRNASPVSTLIK